MNGRCKSRIPRAFRKDSSCEDDGYPFYPQRRDERSFELNEFHLTTDRSCRKIPTWRQNTTAISMSRSRPTLLLYNTPSNTSAKATTEVHSFFIKAIKT